MASSTLFFSFWTSYFVLGYSQLTMLWEFQVNSQGTQPYLCMNPFSPQLQCYINTSPLLWSTGCIGVPCGQLLEDKEPEIGSWTDWLCMRMQAENRWWPHYSSSQGWPWRTVVREQLPQKQSFRQCWSPTLCGKRLEYTWSHELNDGCLNWLVRA